MIESWYWNCPASVGTLAGFHSGKEFRTLDSWATKSEQNAGAGTNCFGLLLGEAAAISIRRFLESNSATRPPLSGQIAEARVSSALCYCHLSRRRWLGKRRT